MSRGRGETEPGEEPLDAPVARDGRGVDVVAVVLGREVGGSAQQGVPHAVPARLRRDEQHVQVQAGALREEVGRHDPAQDDADDAAVLLRDQHVAAGRDEHAQVLQQPVELLGAELGPGGRVVARDRGQRRDGRQVGLPRQVYVEHSAHACLLPGVWEPEFTFGPAQTLVLPGPAENMRPQISPAPDGARNGRQRVRLRRRPAR